MEGAECGREASYTLQSEEYLKTKFPTLEFTKPSSACRDAALIAGPELFRRGQEESKWSSAHGGDMLATLALQLVRYVLVAQLHVRFRSLQVLVQLLL